MAVSATTPTVAAPSAPTQAPEGREERGRFSCGQERSAYAGRTGSFADGQSRRLAADACTGRFSTGQETRAAAGCDREGGFADGMCQIV